MGDFKINYIKQPIDDTTNSARLIKAETKIKEIFWLDNLSMNVCIAMILNKNIEEMRTQNPHRLLYGKYLGGFAFEGFMSLPPLCILQVVFDGRPNNAVYYNKTLYDPRLGILGVDEYIRKDLQILSYIQIFIPEAYNNTDWKPIIPNEILKELKGNSSLENIWNRLSVMEQSKILNYIYPFSKPSSLDENRMLSMPLKPKQAESIISYINSLDCPESGKSCWDELNDFETVEAVEILKKCGLTEGMTALDLGCGHGHYTFAAGIAVGESGKVFAVDMDKKVLTHVEARSVSLNLKNIICVKANEKGLSEQTESFDFVILYDVLHGVFNYTKADWGKTTEIEFVSDVVSLLKVGGILSLALYSEIEHKKVPFRTKDNEESFRTVPIPHEEAIQPYIALLQSNGLKLERIIENGGVHFDDFHSPHHWRKYGEVRIGTLERRSIYNFIKKY